VRHRQSFVDNTSERRDRPVITGFLEHGNVRDQLPEVPTASYASPRLIQLRIRRSGTLSRGELNYSWRCCRHAAS
jgi:hypothetical protein